MEERGNKTIICSVFFLDIVEYSKKSVSGQISLKERFNAFLSTAIRDVPINDRIILDTGDGAAISFLGDVEDALRAALSMRSSLLSEEGLQDPPLLVRMGVNLGPVRLVKDINGQPNIVGDGINVSQRVMGFAEPGQILVSRSYYDAASRLSQEYAGMFRFEGSRTDKHVREHEVYAIGHPGDVEVPRELVDKDQKKNIPKLTAKLSVVLGELRVKSLFYWEALRVRQNELTVRMVETFKHGSNKQKAVYVGIIAIPFLLLLLLIKLTFKSESPLKDAPKVAEVNSLAVVEAAKSGVSPASSVSATVSSAAKQAAPAHESKSNAHSKQEKKKEKKLKQEQKSTAKSVEQPSGPPGVVALTIKPWGEVYLDGKMIDLSPPLIKLQVPVGAHVIEIRNTTFPIYRQSVDVKPGEKLSINYKFGN